MTKCSLTARQLLGNSNKTSVKNKSEILQIATLQDSCRQQLLNKLNIISSKLNPDKISNRDINTAYLSFSNAQEIIHRLLTCDRIVLQPHIIPKITALELSNKLNITVNQLEELQKFPSSYEKMAKHISLPLAGLYCSVALQQPKSIHDGGCAS